MQQVIVIHGGTTFADNDQYFKYLQTKPLTIERLTYQPMWKELLQQNLGNNYQVLLPAMPNKTNARYNEWSLWFTHLTELITDDCILIGHSLGSIFLAKYLSENTFPKRISSTILVAAPFSDETNEDLTDFKIDSLSGQFAAQAGTLVFFNGSDDPVVSLEEMEKYKALVPDAEFNVLSAPDHFMRVEFPELIARINHLQVS